MITDSDSFSNNIHESDSDVSINSIYHEKWGSQPVHNPQEICEVNGSANAQETSVAVDHQTNSCSSIGHDQWVHVSNIEMGADMQPLEASTSSVPITGNEPATILPLDKENNENQINYGNETANISTAPSDDVEFDITNV